MTSGNQQVDKDGENKNWWNLTLLDAICPWLEV